jgi:PAS domain S-box-containing protein
LSGESVVRGLLAAFPGGIVYVRRDGSIQDANAEALRILGYRHDSLANRYVSDFELETTHEDGSPFPVADYPVARVLATGMPAGPTTIGVRRPDGEVCWAVFQAVPLRDAAGELEGAIVSILDITERKRAEEAMRRSEQKWRGLALNLPDFVVVLDRQARFRSVNRVLPDLQESDVLGAQVYEYIDPDFVDEYRCRVETAFETGLPQRMETRARGPNGTSVWYDVIFAPIAEVGSWADHLIVVARDVTERRAMLASLAEKERLASIGLLAASVAHEIMNPLTYVLANLELALSNRCDDAERRRRALIEVQDGATRMQQIVFDLRALGRADGEELFYVDPRGVMETAVRLSGPEVAKTARVLVDIKDVPSVVASESRLCQVFINLLVNAAQAVQDRPREEREIRVWSRLDGPPDFVGICVSDTGSGIPRDRLERIFEPFYTTKGSGTGLGLSISRDIVLRMGGRIEVESEPRLGSTFTVWLTTTRT